MNAAAASSIGVATSFSPQEAETLNIHGMLVASSK